MGRVYWFWYRAWNSVGWGPYSDIAYYRAADVPSPPPAPVYDSADDTKITITLIESPNNNGAFIDYYELYWNSGPGTPLTIPISDYDGFSRSFTLDVAIDNTLIVGTLYSF